MGLEHHLSKEHCSGWSRDWILQAVTLGLRNSYLLCSPLQIKMLPALVGDPCDPKLVQGAGCLQPLYIWGCCLPMVTIAAFCCLKRQEGIQEAFAL